MRSRGLSLVVLSWLLLGSASAQDPTSKQTRADELFEEGRKLLNEGDHNAAAACAKFEEAIKLDPEAPGTLLNLGLCNEKLHKYKSALYWFRKAQARAAETDLPDYEAAAKQHTVDLASKVATIKITFASTPPDGTKVKIDGQEIQPADYLSAEVDPGSHTLVAGAPGRRIFTQAFTVEGRGGNELTIELVEGDNSVVVDPGAGRRRTAIILAAGGGVLMAASGLLSWHARARYFDCVSKQTGEIKTMLANSDCPETDPTAAAKLANKYQWRAEWVYTSLFVAGAVTVGLASYLYFTAPDKERVDRTVFTPVVGPSEIGLAVSGGF